MIKSINVLTGVITTSNEEAPSFELSPEAALIAWRATAKVSRFQAFAALYAAGFLDDATAAVTQAGGVALLAWENAIEFRRNSPTIAALAGAIGLDDAALDTLFTAAAGIDA
jgi:hypothetical protein